MLLHCDNDVLLIERMQASGSGERCVFKELHSVDHYTQFQSVVDQRWFVGFNRRGRRLTTSGRARDRGQDRGRGRGRRRRRRRCFQFIKTAVQTHDVVPTISYERLHSVLHQT